MRIYHFTKDNSELYRWFVPWDYQERAGRCPKCGRTTFRRVFPSKASYCDGEPAPISPGLLIYADREIAEDLAAHFEGIEAKEVNVYRGEPRFNRPYQGKEIREIWFPLHIPYKAAPLGVEPVKECPNCDAILSGGLVIGIEPPFPESRKFSATLGINPEPPVGAGLHVPQELIGDNMAFRYGGERPMVLEPVRDYVLGKRWKNVCFYCYGEVVGPGLP